MKKIYQQPMSMRKSFEGLSAAIEHLFPGESKKPIKKPNPLI